ncbi:hypothetical protein MHBO_000969 [Bonamia ostreae]|uniref:Uncharacterized protein n=1 Tax=Bonamia ostreae TaxID=126728 RepID=A0ABV2AIA2_9EUKA
MVKELLHRKKTSSEETHRLVEEFKTLYLQKKDVDMQQKQRIIFSDKGVFEQWTYNRQMIHKNFSKAVNLQLLDEILAEERSARLGH